MLKLKQKLYRKLHIPAWSKTNPLIGRIEHDPRNQNGSVRKARKAI